MLTTTLERRIEERTQALGREMFARMRHAKPTPLQFTWWQERMLQVLMQDEWFKVQSFRFIDVLPAMRDDVELARHLREYFTRPPTRTRRVTIPDRPRPSPMLEWDPSEHGGHRASQQDGSRHASQHNGGYGGNGHSAAGGPPDGLHELSPQPAIRQLVKLVSWMMDFRRLDGVPARVFAGVARFSAALMAGSFIAGSTIDEAVRTIRRMRARQMAFTIDVLGESAVSSDEAAAYHRTYTELIEALPKFAADWDPVPLVDEGDGQPLPRINVSVKLTSLYPGFDPIAPEATKARAKELLRPLLRAAMRHGEHLHIDMEHYAIKDLTLELCEELFAEPEFRDYPHFGLVLQAYLKEGDADAQRVIDYARRRGTPVWVRLVKGAYWDSETVWAAQRRWPVPVWEQKWQSDACYERMTYALLSNYRHVRCAFASHNVRSLCHAIACREALEVPGWAFELQMLYGMGDPIKHAGVGMGQRCRIYTPYGQMLAGMAYLIRRLLENTANESFLRQSGDESADVAALLENPRLTGASAPPVERPVVVRYEFEEPIMQPFENVPCTDFSLAAERARMHAALAAQRTLAGREVPLRIGGERVTTGQWFESRNPSRPAEIVARAARADGAALERAVAAARDAWSDWRRTPAHRRSALVRRTGELLAARRFDLAALHCLEVGKTWREADADVSEAIDYCNYYAAEMERIDSHRRRRDIEGETNEHHYAPRGVAAVISPWNFPLSLLVNMVSAALVTGNTVVLKPASAAAAIAGAFVDAALEAGLPPGVLNLLTGPGRELGPRLVEHPQVDIVAFTGSRAVGLEINQRAAQAPTARPGVRKVILEMGAKNAIIVDADADLDEAIKGILASALSYAGQKCSAAARIIVLDAAHDRFMDRFVAAVRSKGVGPADEPTTAIPPVIDREAFDSIRAYIELGRREARCVLAVETDDIVASTGGYYIGPHIFDDVPPTAHIAREEIFGPVLCVLRARDFEHAIALFNDSDYALTGGLFSRSPADIERARAACECGNLYINRPITGSRVDLQPFGGFKLSGGGAKIGGPDYLIQYCEPRTVTENTLRRGFAPSEEIVEALA